MGCRRSAVQAAGGTVTVVYAHTDQLGSTVPCDTTVNVTWKSVTSLDGAVNWPVTGTIRTSGGQRACVPPVANTVRTGLRNFGFTRDPGGALWVASE